MSRPPTEVAQERLCSRWEKQCEDRLAQNEEECMAYDMNTFFFKFRSLI